jgi:hypothetical protein
MGESRGRNDRVTLPVDLAHPGAQDRVLCNAAIMPLFRASNRSWTLQGVDEGLLFGGWSEYETTDSWQAPTQAGPETK